MTAPASSVLVATALVLTGCGAGTAGPTPGRTGMGGSPPMEVDPAAALCRAERLAQAGDTRAAGAAFVDGAHGAIHDLAAELGSAGLAPEAGRLLEAKQRVEAALRAATSGEELADLLVELREAYDAALAATGAPPAEVCA